MEGEGRKERTHELASDHLLVVGGGSHAGRVVVVELDKCEPLVDRDARDGAVLAEDRFEILSRNSRRVQVADEHTSTRTRWVIRHCA